MDVLFLRSLSFNYKFRASSIQHYRYMTFRDKSQVYPAEKDKSAFKSWLSLYNSVVLGKLLTSQNCYED